MGQLGGYQLGIDLGTTYTSAAVCRSDDRRFTEPEVVSLGSRSAAVPSVLFLGPDGAVVVGEAAERRALTDPDRVVREFKRRGMRPEISCAAGKIICISSVHEVIPWAGHVNYAASKGGVKLLMQSIAQEVAPHRIRVNSICPGAIRTPINRDAWSTPEAYNELLKLIPYKRIGEVDDIGRVATWLVSDQADYIHGASIFVDGGMTLYPGFEAGG